MRKNSTLFRLGSIALASSFFFYTHAQTPNTSPFWSLAGNSNSNTASKLGTTIAEPLNLTTNNLTRIFIATDGKVGIGTTTPGSGSTINTKLHVFGTGTGVSGRTQAIIENNAASAGANLIVKNNLGNTLSISSFGSTYGSGLSDNQSLTATNELVLGTNWSVASGGTSAISFRPGGYGTVQERMRILANGNVGIGTTVPVSRLDILGGNWDLASTEGDMRVGNASYRLKIGVATAGGGAGDARIRAVGGTNRLILGAADALTIDGSGRVGIGTITPAFRLDVAGRIRLRDEGGSSSAGIWLNNRTNTGATGFIGVYDNNHMGFYGNTSGWSVLMNTDNGYLGVKNANPQTELHVVHGINSGATFGLRVQNSGSNNNEWTLYVQNSNGNLELYKNGSIRGRFDNTSGAYTAASDARLKKNVEESEDVLDNIMKLGVKRYQFIKNQTDGRRYYGMIAQEVEKVFPDIVFHSKGDDGKDLYTMDYSVTGVIAIKGIQELKPVIDKQQEEITQLRQEIAELKQMISRLSGNSALSSAGMGTLGIATPNPAKTAARIQYSMPDGTANGRLVITDALGRTIKIMQLSQSGIANIDVSALSSGVYNYSLIADGKILQTKKLTVER